MWTKWDPIQYYFYCTLIDDLSWPEDGPVTAETCSQISPNCNYCILFDACCVLTVHNILYRFDDTQRDGLFRICCERVYELLVTKQQAASTPYINYIDKIEQGPTHLTKATGHFKILNVSWIKIDQLDVTCFIISLFTTQHVSNVSTSIFRSLRLIVDLFHGMYCSGSMCVGVTVWFGWGGVVSGSRMKHCFSLHKDTTPAGA